MVAIESSFPEPAHDAGELPLTKFMARDPICIGPSLDVKTVVELMVARHIGCLPVIDDQRKPIGVITKFDVMEQLDTAMRCAMAGDPLPADLAARTAEDIMMPLVLTLPEHATLAHAAAMMVSEDTHHVIVVDVTGVLVGVITSKDIVRWVALHP